ncbi:hypothetical protein CFD26_108362 [Aspergillus turcosus]|uniref:Uncharacterized protein n=1 Tax=Aspergillus turcosus TaxID=1245748 RepID=A0A421DD57_9EURO|nr:hypothetical protein CFD26_108362 [Aspergillus turcosus]
MLERVDSFLKTMLERVRPAMPYTNKSALIIGGSHGIGLSTAHLFINAGYTALEPFADVSEASFRRTFDTNVFGAFFVAQKLATMVRPGGAIVFTTSVANQMGIPGMSYAGGGGGGFAGGEEYGDGEDWEPAEVAKAVAFLGFEATFTTGEQVVVDGGWLRCGCIEVI